MREKSVDRAVRRFEVLKKLPEKKPGPVSLRAKIRRGISTDSRAGDSQEDISRLVWSVMMIR